MDQSPAHLSRTTGPGRRRLTSWNGDAQRRASRRLSPAGRASGVYVLPECAGFSHGSNPEMRVALLVRLKVVFGLEPL